MVGIPGPGISLFASLKWQQVVGEAVPLQGFCHGVPLAP